MALVKYADLATRLGYVEVEIVIEKEEKCQCIKKSREQCPVCAGTGIVPAGSVLKRWARPVEFNPNSSQQVKKFIKFMRHPVPKSQKKVDAQGEAAETTEMKELERLAQKTKHPIYPLLIEKRQLTKVEGTYVEGWKPGKDGAIHTTFTFQTGTWQTSSRAPNCFSADTEILTMRGWVLFPEVKGNDTFAQYDYQTGEIDFSWALEQHVQDFTGELHHIHTEEQIDLLMTGDHRCLLQNRRTKTFGFYSASSYPPDMIQMQAGRGTGDYLDWCESQIILICALQADGHVHKPCGRNPGGQFSFRFVKERKIRRFLGALADQKIPYTEHVDKRGGRKFYVACDAIPAWWADKKMFGVWIAQLSRQALDYFAEEVWFWDGCASRRSMYASKHKLNADWVQIATLLSGRRARLRSYQPALANRALSWQVDATDMPYSMTTNAKNEKVPYSGKVYCVTMPKGTVIVRRNNRAVITGNCQNGLKHGKTPFQKGLSTAFNAMQRAAEGRVLINFDFKSFHALTTAHDFNIPDYARLARIDIHSFVTCFFLKHPLREKLWGMSDQEMSALFKELKKDEKFKFCRDFKAKRAILGIQFGMGYRKLFQLNRDDFDSETEARVVWEMVYALFPKLRLAQDEIRRKAAEDHRLVNQFGAVRWFWDVERWDRKQQRMVAGEQAEQAVAFLPASHAFGHVRDVLLRCDQLGYTERYGFVNQIHDSFLCHCPLELKDECVRNVKAEMERPSTILVYPKMAPLGFQVDADAMSGPSLAEME